VTGATKNDAVAAETTGVGIGARELIVMLSAVMALMAMGLDLILPGFDEIRETFALGEGSNRTGQLITFYFFGLAGAQFVWGPLADRFGRKPVLYVGIGIYIVGAAASALAPTFNLLLAARVLWGVGAAASRVVATSIIRDRFVGERMAKAMSQIMAVFVLVPVIAPSFGAVIVAFLPWQAVFWFCAIWAIAIGLWSLRLRETLAPEYVRPLNPRGVLRSYAEVIRIPTTLGYTIASMFLQVAFTLYLATSELIIGEIYGRPGQFPVIFGVVAIGFGLAAFLNGHLVERFGIPTMIAGAVLFAIAGSTLLVAISITADGAPNFWLFMLLTGLTLSSFMLLMPNMNTEALTPVGHIAGVASAFTSAIRIGFGSAIAGLIINRVDDSVTPFAIALLATVLATATSVAIIRRLPRVETSM